ncbi:MAG TPA: histidine phosphatase family protein [Stackebrandtia sp.]|jgi:probable phosphoglycerate mutase|uniref:histidine phosphatase family protein n=1 Tax=Stackebrandtia sp. TaxID=2023065 RepID=UPI002D24D739|nr:histidine phosphatase family protein [Stackebrandtia sp.]HZE40829.1 histidine phosphatase family protein [Stackebrandtia sp.]
MSDTVVLLIRHGETSFHARNRYCGRTDAPLTARGRRQAADLAVWAATARLDAVYSSTLRRAADTADPSAHAAGVRCTRDARLVELDFGLAEGLTAGEMAERWPEQRAAFVSDPVAHPLPGGEDPRAAIDRGAAAVADMAARHRGGRVLAVCHSTLLRLVTCGLTGIDPAGYRARFPKVANTSGAVLRHRGPRGDWELVDFNPALTNGVPGHRPIT